jgi:hypothetical protein
MTIGGEDTKRQVAVAHTIQEMLAKKPDTLLLFAHDNTDYQFKHIVPFLADGILDAAEQQAIRQYRTGLFTRDWQLRPGYKAHFKAGPSGAANGKVIFR